MRSLLTLAIASALFATTGLAQTTSLGPGCDCWFTGGNTKTTIPAIPAGFFGTGSQATFSQVVLLQGKPLPPATVALWCNPPVVNRIAFDAHGNSVDPNSIHAVSQTVTITEPVDTIVCRPGATPFISAGKQTKVTIEIKELSLQCVNPIKVQFGTGSGAVIEDYCVSIEDSGTQTQGSYIMNVISINPIKATTQLVSLPVRYKIILTPTNTSLATKTIDNLTLNLNTGRGTFCQVDPKKTDPSITAPPGFVNKSAGGYAGFPYAAYVHGARNQIGDPSRAGTKAVSLKRLQFRTQSVFNYSPGTGTGRYFTNVVLSMGHTDCDKFTNTFSTNVIGTLTKVFSGSLFLPSYVNNIPAQEWGNAGCFPFRSPWPYNGKDDILQDWVYSKASMANGNTTLFAGANYYIDGCQNSPFGGTGCVIAPNSTCAPGSQYTPRDPFTGTRCSDSGQSSTVDFYSYLSAVLYYDHHPTSSLQCKIRRRSAFFNGGRRGSATAPAGFISMLSLGGSLQGIPSPAFKCNPLHVNTGFPLLIVTGKNTSSSGFYSFSANEFPTLLINYKNNNWPGNYIYWQTANEDSRTKQVLLSIATRLCLPRKPPKDLCPPGCTAYEYTDINGLKRGPFGPLKGTFYQPTDGYN